MGEECFTAALFLLKINVMYLHTISDSADDKRILFGVP